MARIGCGDSRVPNQELAETKEIRALNFVSNYWLVVDTQGNSYLDSLLDLFLSSPGHSRQFFLLLEYIWLYFNSESYCFCCAINW